MPFTVPCTQVAPAWAADGGGGREPEVVVPVPVDGYLVVEPLDYLVDEERRGLGRCDPERVDDDDLLRARLDGALVHLAHEREVGARGIDAEERNANALPGCERDRRADPLEHRRPRHAEGGELPVRDRAFDHGRLQAQLQECLHVRADGSREAPDLRIETRFEDQRDRACVVLRHAREPGLDPIDAGFGQRLCNLHFLLWIEHDSDGLLTVAEGRIVEADGHARLWLERVRVQVARPHPRAVDRHARTIPSGNAESFSAPVSVTRKLSSTRRPPPPSI